MCILANKTTQMFNFMVDCYYTENIFMINMINDFPDWLKYVTYYRVKTILNHKGTNLKDQPDI